MGRKITAAQADLWRAELREGHTVESVAARHGVTAQTVRRHASFEVAGRSLLLGTEVHIAGMRGRWEFRGEVGHARDGEQYAKFVHARTGRSRILYTRLISAVHRYGGSQTRTTESEIA
jgi:hypothetical protein